MGDSKQDIPNGLSVQVRLLSAAELRFCEQGYDKTSVRDIAATADCNVASINYYFGGKENLYVEVWRRHFAALRERRLAGIDKVMSGDVRPELEDLLRSYAESFLEPLVEGGPGCRFVNLMAREMIDPHLPPDMFLEEMAMPVMTAFGAALQTICPRLDESVVRPVILSIVGQLMQIVLAKGMFEKSKYEAPEFDVREIVNHVVKFSAAGIRAYADETEEKPYGLRETMSAPVEPGSGDVGGWLHGRAGLFPAENAGGRGDPLRERP